MEARVKGFTSSSTKSRCGLPRYHLLFVTAGLTQPGDHPRSSSATLLHY